PPSLPFRKRADLRSRHEAIPARVAASHEPFQHALELVLFARHPLGRTRLSAWSPLPRGNASRVPATARTGRATPLLRKPACADTNLHWRVREFPVWAVECKSVVDHQPNKPHGQRMSFGGGAKEHGLAPVGVRNPFVEDQHAPGNRTGCALCATGCRE